MEEGREGRRSGLGLVGPETLGPGLGLGSSRVVWTLLVAAAPVPVTSHLGLTEMIRRPGRHLVPGLPLVPCHLRAAPAPSLGATASSDLTVPPPVTGL